MTPEEITALLEERLSTKRFNHSMGCAQTAEKLAKILSSDYKKAYIAGILHDCAKEMPITEQLEYSREHGIEPDHITVKNSCLLHAPVGALIAKYEYKIEDEDILNAIAYHTTGRENMSVLEKIIFVSDMIEPSRNFPGVDILRQHVFENFNDGLIETFDRSISFVLEKGTLLHPMGVYARNYLIEEKINGKK